jgi:hypothetical protein
LLYTFKAEVEKACLGSVVEIDNHTVEYKVRGKIIKKNISGGFLFHSRHVGRGSWLGACLIW